MNFGSEGAKIFLSNENWSIFRHTNPWQMMPFLNPLDALIPNIPFSFFFGRVRVTSGARGAVSVGFWGARQLTPLGGGGVRPEGSIDPPTPPQTESPPSPGAHRRTSGPHCTPEWAVGGVTRQSKPPLLPLIPRAPSPPPVASPPALCTGGAWAPCEGGADSEIVYECLGGLAVAADEWMYELREGAAAHAPDRALRRQLLKVRQGVRDDALRAELGALAAHADPCVARVAKYLRNVVRGRPPRPYARHALCPWPPDPLYPPPPGRPQAAAAPRRGSAGGAGGGAGPEGWVAVTAL